MSRPRKCRKVCRIPQNISFHPSTPLDGEESVTMTVDEYESIRLIDKVGLSQEECADFMGVARTTVQQIYTDARRKLADALVDGLPLFIRGGSYQLCDGSSCGCTHACQMHHCCPFDHTQEE